MNCCRQAPDCPYLVIEREMHADDEHKIMTEKVYESERCENTVEPSFNLIKINFLRLCQGDTKAPIRFSVWSDNIGSRADLFYGKFTSTLESLLSNVGKEHQLLDEKMRHAGVLRFNKFEQIAKPNFIEYLQKGWYVNMSVAIDFTSSNKDQVTGKSRHDITDTPNQYEVAI
jgi:hypothetical protein